MLQLDRLKNRKMDDPEASCSSRNLVRDGPILPHRERMDRESVHESHASGSDGSNTPLATVCEARTTSPGNATAAIKLNPTLPRYGSTSVIQSSWIQRLKPFAQSNTPKEEPAKIFTKETPICTHFTKDFSSCSRRLNKTSHHTRSSSWPPHAAMQIQGVEHFPLELGEPADITEGHGKAVVVAPNIDYRSIEVPLDNTTQSSDAGSRTGDLFAQQQSRCKQISAVEVFVHSAPNREKSTIKKLNDPEESERRGQSKCKDCPAQQIQTSVEGVKNVTSGGECNIALHMEALFQTEEAPKSVDFSHGSYGASTGDVRAPLSMYTAANSSGASADADDGVLLAKPLDCCKEIKTLPLQTSFKKPDCEIAFVTAVVSEDRINIDKAAEAWCPGREITSTGIVPNEARNYGCVQTVRNFKHFKELVAKPYLLNKISDIGGSSKFFRSSENSYLAEAICNDHGRLVMTTSAEGSKMVAASGSLKQDVVSKRSDEFHSREHNFADLQDPHFSGGGRMNRSIPQVGSLHEDAARSRIREISLGDYWDSWIRLLEGPDNVKVAQTGSPMSKSQQNDVIGECSKNLCHPALSNGGLDTRQKCEDYSSSYLHKHVSDDFGNCGGCDLPQQMLRSSSKSYYKYLDYRLSCSQIKMGYGQECYASADHNSLLSLKGLQSSQKHGGTVGVDLQPCNKESDLPRRFVDLGSCHSRMHSPHSNNERTGEGSSMHQGWIQRWHSSAQVYAMSAKATAPVPCFSRSLISDQLVKSNGTRAQCPLISNHQTIASFDQMELCMGSNRYIEASGTRLDSGSGSTTPGSHLAGRNFAAFRSGYMGSCAEPMTIVGKSTGMLPPKSLQSRGFWGLPCTNPKFVKCKVLPVDEKLPSADPDNLKAVEHDIGDS